MTLRELLVVAEAVRLERWDMAAQICAITASAFQGKPYSAAMFNPLRESNPLNLDDPAREYEKLMRKSKCKPST